MTKPTAQGIVDAAVATVRAEGFAGATSRAIARRGGFNQALIFYYFGSLDAHLVEALARTSELRLERYREALADVTTVEQLLQVGASRRSSRFQSLLTPRSRSTWASTC